MLCPICNLDLTPLDNVSRIEHVNVCLECGPTTSLAFERNGHLISGRLKEPPAKQRIICPVCSKTFQNAHNHFKLCAFKNDIPPHLLMEYWDKINQQMTNNKEPTKPFPREVLDNFILKCLKEDRVGSDLEYAQALSMSMAETENKRSRKKGANKGGLTINLQQQQQQLQETQSSTTRTTIAQDENSIQSIGDDESTSNDDCSVAMATDDQEGCSNLESVNDISQDKVSSIVTQGAASNQTQVSGHLATTSQLVLNPSSCVVNMLRNETMKQTQVITDHTETQQVLLPQAKINGLPVNIMTLNHLKQPAKIGPKSPKKKHPLELMDYEDRCNAIQLRIERELAASHTWRRITAPSLTMTQGDNRESELTSNLWLKARLAKCDIQSCMDDYCDHDDSKFILDEFIKYAANLNQVDTNEAHAATGEHDADNGDDSQDESLVNDHANLSQDLLGLVNKQWMADLLIKSGYTKFYTHKLVWFTRTFKNNRPNMTLDGLPTIDMSDFRPETIRHMLNYIYGSILPANECELHDDLKALASRLGCQNLVDMINSLAKQKSHDLSMASQSTSNLKVLSCPVGRR